MVSFTSHSIPVVTLVTDSRDCVCDPAAQTFFSGPAPDAFGASFSLETGLNTPQDTLQDRGGDGSAELVS